MGEAVAGLLEELSRRTPKKFTPFCSVVLNAPFCPIKQKLRRNECEVSMVKIPQHKVTKWGKFFRGSFLDFLSNPVIFFCSGVLTLAPVEKILHKSLPPMEISTAF